MDWAGAVSTSPPPGPRWHLRLLSSPPPSDPAVHLYHLRPASLTHPDRYCYCYSLPLPLLPPPPELLHDLCRSPSPPRCLCYCCYCRPDLCPPRAPRSSASPCLVWPHLRRCWAWRCCWGSGAAGPWPWVCFALLPRNNEQSGRALACGAMREQDDFLGERNRESI